MAATLLSINNYYYPRGGAEVVFFRHNGMLHDAGFNVVPFAMNHRMNVGGAERSEFASEVEYGRESDGLAAKIRKGLKGVYSFEARTKLAHLIDRSAPDVCHAHNVYHHLSPSILGLVRARGIPLVMTLHDLKLACPAYSMLTHDGVCERCRDGRLYQVVTNRCMKGSLALSALVMLESYLHRAARQLSAQRRPVPRAEPVLHSEARRVGIPRRAVRVPAELRRHRLVRGVLRAGNAVRLFRAPVARERHRDADSRSRGRQRSASTSLARARRSRSCAPSPPATTCGFWAS